MNRSRWERVEEVFQGALDRPSGARNAYLDEACAGDAALRKEVVELLAQHDTDPDFLGQPLVDLSKAVDGAAAVNSAERVGPYRIVRQLGAGGMGVVYLAMHEGQGFERAVALKVIRRGMDTDDVLRRFQLERRILAALRHPNIAHFLDAGATADGRPYFVMDFVEGVPIDVHCERARLTISQKLRLFQTVCGAVQHAHGNLIVHRDLKPGNILVGNDGAPVLLDFGIGKLIDPMDAAGSGSTHTGIRAFTPEYASPEQVRGEQVSTATDVFGLGLLLFRVLTGKRTYEGSTPSDYEKAVLEQDPPRPSDVGGRELAGDLDTIVLKALRKEPERRYLSVAALADDIGRHLDGLPVLARDDTFSYRTGKFVRRHRLPLAAAGVVFASLIAATLYSTSQARAVAHERDKALEVQTFLMEMFGASGRDRADTVSVRQLMDGQAALVPIVYADRPEMRAQMSAVLAEGYDRLALLPQAEPLARTALEIRRGMLRPDHPDLAMSTSLLGWILHQRGKSKDGEVLLREALALWPNARPENPGAHARTLNDLGVVREAAGSYDEAADLYRRALTIRGEQFGDKDRGVATTGSNLAVVLYRKGDIKGAIVAGENALTVMRNAAGPDHQRSMVIQGNLAAFRAATGDFAGAEADYRDVLARQTRVLGREHPQNGGTLFAIGSVLRSQRKFAESETFLAEALGVYEKALGPEHARVAVTLTQLGSVRSSQGRFTEARPLIERALAISRKLRGEIHRDVATALSALGTLHGDAGDWVASERMHRQALDVWERAMGKQHAEVVAARARLARAELVRDSVRAASAKGSAKR